MSLVSVRDQLESVLSQVEQADGLLVSHVEQIVDCAKECRKSVSNTQGLCQSLATMGQNTDTPFPAKLYCQIWVSRSTISRYVKDGMPTCYREGHLCIKPVDFFKYYAKSETSKPLSQPSHISQ